MLKKAIILMLLLPAAALFGYVVFRKAADAREASVAALEAIPAEDIVVPARAPGDWVRSGRLVRGASVDLCLGTREPVRAATIHHARCRHGETYCRAFVRVRAAEAPRALAGYDFDHPPQVIVAGGAC
ncbi:MAG TPA: hypothetical protein VEA15_04995 [Caulobacteraceae bacterium]|nr:hypothetical protein [Caulobacteraceae bacterium]